MQTQPLPADFSFVPILKVSDVFMCHKYVEDKKMNWVRTAVVSESFAFFSGFINHRPSNIATIKSSYGFRTSKGIRYFTYLT